MSLETLNIMNGHRKEATENSPASETFSIVGGVAPDDTFKGIWDRSPFVENKDAGNVLQKNMHSRIMVNSRPVGLTPKTTKITREGSLIEYTFQRYLIDDEGQGLLWLA
jgi:hypothetical protein